jgi:hypothetical protein
MIQRYIIAMNDYWFKLKHLPGIRNVLPDVLSRRFEGFKQQNGGEGMDKSFNAITRSMTNQQSKQTVHFADNLHTITEDAPENENQQNVHVNENIIYDKDDNESQGKDDIESQRKDDNESQRKEDVNPTKANIRNREITED